MRRLWDGFWRFGLIGLRRFGAVRYWHGGTLGTLQSRQSIVLGSSRFHVSKSWIYILVFNITRSTGKT